MDSLIVFDVDGTLCDTCGVDDELFATTLASQLGARIDPASWRDVPHVTDTGIVNWLWTRHRDRLPTPDESEAFAVAFEAALRVERERAPARFSAVAGARDLIEHLESTGWPYVIATGGLSRTARLKLAAAGLPADRLLASSDDSPEREEIFDLARRRQIARAGGTPTRIILVGDGVWDVRTAQRLGWHMVGIGAGERAADLRLAGAGIILADFLDREATLAAIGAARVPLGPRADTLRLVPHDGSWSSRFEAEAARVRAALGAVPLTIEHVGSTAVPGLAGKPVLDVAVAVPSDTVADACVAPLQELGYAYRGPHGDDPRRRYYVRDERGARAVQLHLYVLPAPAWDAKLAFRDALRADPSLASAYAAEKYRVADAVGWDKRAYALTKGAYVERVLAAIADQERSRTPNTIR